MVRVLLLFFSCVFFCSKVSAQIDSTPRQPDTSIHALPVRHDSIIIHHLSHRDSVRRDSIRHARAAIRDSLRRDSLARLTADTSHPTPVVVAQQPTAPPPPKVREVSGGITPDLLMKVLKANRYFNLTGPPVPLPFQIHQGHSKDSLFYLLVAILFYFALIRLFFEKYFNNLMTLFFRVSLRQQQIREQVLQTPLPSLLLNILFVISVGLYACFILHYSDLGENVNFWLLFLDCMAALSVIYLVKFLVLKFAGWVFSISRATDIYIFIVFLVNKMLGIFLLPFLILITFSEGETRKVFITISLAMVFVLWMYRILAAYRPVRNEIKLTPFHFFLYLCAFEIAPLLLIYKVLLTYLEKVY